MFQGLHYQIQKLVDKNTNSLKTYEQISDCWLRLNAAELIMHTLHVVKFVLVWLYRVKIAYLFASDIVHLVEGVAPTLFNGFAWLRRHISKHTIFNSVMAGKIEDVI